LQTRRGHRPERRAELVEAQTVFLDGNDAIDGLIDADVPALPSPRRGRH
jgi:hypothetical protein